MNKRLISTLLAFALLAAILVIAIKKGGQRNIYEAEHFTTFLPIPELYEDYVGGFTWLEDGRVKVAWQHRDIHPAQSRTFFVCEGRIKASHKYYYLLEMDGQRYVEKAEHIEPLIHALLALSRGNDRDNHEATVLESIAALPTDKALLEQLVMRIKKNTN